jgi:hypothetical protein
MKLEKILSKIIFGVTLVVIIAIFVTLIVLIF